jgi:hypothetical protein
MISRTVLQFNINPSNLGRKGVKHIYINVKRLLGVRGILFLGE